MQNSHRQLINMERVRWIAFLRGFSMLLILAFHTEVYYKEYNVTPYYIYTTNAIESLNSTYRRLNSQRSVFPSDTALLKALYLSTFEATKKWTMPVRNWGKVYGELAIMYDGRLPD